MTPLGTGACIVEEYREHEAARKASGRGDGDSAAGFSCQLETIVMVEAIPLMNPV